VWRDIKVYKDHAFIVSDGAGLHGMQVFDLRQLRSVRNAPVSFAATAHYDGIGSAHNIVINEETGFAYAVGVNAAGETCGGGLHMIDIKEPTNPTFVGCFQDTSTGFQRTGYTHDAMCVVYDGPDTEYRGREICFGGNETALSIADVTDKSNPIALSSASYPSVGYAHQGWISEDHEYFYLDDEGDELQGTTNGRTRTLVFDIKDLDDPVLATEFFGTTAASDHNLYIKGNLMYQSNYVAGLRVIDISDPENPKEVGYFDTARGENVAGFAGTWSNYPFFASGTVVVTSGREGLFLVRKKQTLVP
jgi:choice-of-anchor B domain-containing protein